MRKDKLSKLITKHQFFNGIEYENKMGPEGKIIRTQFKTWTFTEDQLKSFVKDVEKDVLSKYEIIS